MCEPDEPYKPNKYTRHISVHDWRKLNRGEVSEVTVIDPGYINEPGEESRKAPPPDRNDT